VETPENEDGEFEVDTLSRPQPVKLSQKRCDVLAPTSPVDESGGGVLVHESGGGVEH